MPDDILDQKTIFIDEQGDLKFIYDDELMAELADVGQPTIRRASHVEPTTDGRWEADLSPVGGPKLGPFDFRSQALHTEAQWLEEHLAEI